jgi:hypothetical protein
MTSSHPRIRIHTGHGGIQIRDGIAISFYMAHAHQDIAQAVERALGIFRRVIAPVVLDHYLDREGYWIPLDERGQQYIRDEFQNIDGADVHLVEDAIGVSEHQFVYHGQFGTQELSTVTFWLPTEFMDAHGASQVHELALRLSSELPYVSGHAGLAFNANSSILGVGDRLYEDRLPYPGMDVPDDGASWHLGLRVRGVHWMNFLGPPILTEAGGVEALRARLKSPGTTVQPQGEDRAVITLGPEPDAGDTSTPPVLPAYRELARVLEPWTYFHEKSRPSIDLEAQQRWERRFLD